MSEILKPGAAVYVKFNDQWCRHIVQRYHEALGGSYTIQNGVGVATCGLSDAVPEAEHFARILKEEEPEARERLAGILEAHALGNVTVKAVAEFLKVKQIAVRSRFHEAVRRGFIPPEPMSQREALQLVCRKAIAWSNGAEDVQEIRAAVIMLMPEAAKEPESSNETAHLG